MHSNIMTVVFLFDVTQSRYRFEFIKKNTRYNSVLEYFSYTTAGKHRIRKYKVTQYAYICNSRQLTIKRMLGSSKLVYENTYEINRLPNFKLILYRISFSAYSLYIKVDSYSFCC